MDKKKMIVILIGPPGSGKGTQAELLSKKLGLFHLESSKVIEDKFKDASTNDKIIVREKRLWESGKLNTPELVLEWMVARARELINDGKGLVFSGSPRTLVEAEGLIPAIEELVGKENVGVLNIELSEEDSVKRNSKRRICEKFRHPIPDFPEFRHLKKCPKDGSDLVTRSLDDPETIPIRYKEYLDRTAPILGLMKKMGYKIPKINGEQSIEIVFNEILKNLEYRN
jgi:adenylate kinase